MYYTHTHEDCTTMLYADKEEGSWEEEEEKHVSSPLQQRDQRERERSEDVSRLGWLLLLQVFIRL